LWGWRGFGFGGFGGFGAVATVLVEVGGAAATTTTIGWEEWRSDASFHGREQLTAQKEPLGSLAEEEEEEDGPLSRLKRGRRGGGDGIVCYHESKHSSSKHRNRASGWRWWMDCIR
jgi:hypothetical protein